MHYFKVVKGIGAKLRMKWNLRSYDRQVISQSQETAEVLLSNNSYISPTHFKNNCFLSFCTKPSKVWMLTTFSTNRRPWHKQFNQFNVFSYRKCCLHDCFIHVRTAGQDPQMCTIIKMAMSSRNCCAAVFCWFQNRLPKHILSQGVRLHWIQHKHQQDQHNPHFLIKMMTTLSS